MNIQFHHKRKVSKYVLEFGGITNTKTVVSAKGGITIALQVLSLEQFNSFEVLDTTQDCWEYHLPTIELDVGITKCSNDDNYNKKIGRNIATGRMQTAVFWVRKHSSNEIILVATQSSFKLPELVLKLSPKGGRVHFVGVL